MQEVDRSTRLAELKDGYHQLDNILQQLSSVYQIENDKVISVQTLSEMREKLLEADLRNGRLVEEKEEAIKLAKLRADEISKISEKIKKEKEQNDSYREVIRTLNEYLAKKNLAAVSMRMTIETLQKDMKAAKTAKEKLSQDMQKMKTKHDQKISQSNEECAVQKLVAGIIEKQGKHRVEELSKENKELKEALNALKSTVTSLNKAVENKNTIAVELSKTQALMNDFKSKAGSYKHAVETQKKQVAQLKQNLAQLSQQLSSKNAAEVELEGSIAEKTRIIENLQRDLANIHRKPSTMSCSICASPFGSNAVVATKCGHIYHSLCLNNRFAISKKCLNCGKGVSMEQLLQINLDTNGAATAPIDSTSLIHLFAKDKELMSQRIVQLERDSNISQEKFKDVNKLYSETKAELAMVTFCLEIYRQSSIELCRTWNVDAPRKDIVNEACPAQTNILEKCKGIYEQHKMIASNLSNVTKCIDGLWTQHFWSMCKKWGFQSIGLAVLFKWGPDSEQLPFAMAGVFFAGEIINMIDLVRMKRSGQPQIPLQ